MDQTAPAYASPVAQTKGPVEPPGSAFSALAEASKLAAEASETFPAARQRWVDAQAQLAEATDRVNRAREGMGI